MYQCTGLRSLFKPLAVASLIYRHSVPLVLFRLGVCCCLRRDVDARNGSGRVLRGRGRNHWACVRSESSSRRCFLLLAECYIARRAFALFQVFISSQLTLNFNVVYWDSIFYYIIILSFLPKGRAFTAKAGTNVAVLSKGRSSMQSWHRRIRLCHTLTKIPDVFFNNIIGSYNSGN